MILEDYLMKIKLQFAQLLEYSQHFERKTDLYNRLVQIKIILSMINKQKQSYQSSHQSPTIKQLWSKAVKGYKGIRSPSKLLKYSYKHSHYQKDTSVTKQKDNFIRLYINAYNKQQTIPKDQVQGLVRDYHPFAKSQLSHFQKDKSTLNNSQLLFQDKKYNRKDIRRNSCTFNKSYTQGQEVDESLVNFTKCKRKSSAKKVIPTNPNVPRNPYTNTQYLYVRNQFKDEQAKRHTNHKKKLNFGANIEKSCKIISFVLVNPLEKYQLAQKMQKTNSTLPQFYVEQQEESPQFKIQAKQMSVSHRKRPSYFKNRNIQHSKQSFNSSKKINANSQSTFQPSPWQSPVKNNDSFYLKVEQF